MHSEFLICSHSWRFRPCIDILFAIGVNCLVRELRKAVIHELVKLQERVDSIVTTKPAEEEDLQPAPVMASACDEELALGNHWIKKLVFVRTRMNESTPELNQKDINYPCAEKEDLLYPITQVQGLTQTEEHLKGSIKCMEDLTETNKEDQNRHTIHSEEEVKEAIELDQSREFHSIVCGADHGSDQEKMDIHSVIEFFRTANVDFYEVID
eukprot:Gb_07389 [translate_table: standard]